MDSRDLYLIWVREYLMVNLRGNIFLSSKCHKDMLFILWVLSFLAKNYLNVIRIKSKIMLIFALKSKNINSNLVASNLRMWSLLFRYFHGFALVSCLYYCVEWSRSFETKIILLKHLLIWYKGNSVYAFVFKDDII